VRRLFINYFFSARAYFQSVLLKHLHLVKVNFLNNSGMYFEATLPLFLRQMNECNEQAALTLSLFHFAIVTSSFVITVFHQFLFLLIFIPFILSITLYFIYLCILSFYIHFYLFRCKIYNSVTKYKQLNVCVTRPKSLKYRRCASRSEFFDYGLFSTAYKNNRETEIIAGRLRSLLKMIKDRVLS